MIALLLLGCATPEDPVDDGCGPDAPVDELLVMRALTFARPTGDTSHGFDLDGATTATGGPTGCGVADYVGVDGRPGVDNAFARLLPALELTEAQAVEGIIATTITSGELLITVALTDVDGPDDACVGVEVGRATGAPMLGTDGRLLPGQTFDPDPDVAAVRLDGGALRGGTLEVSGLDLTLPLTGFGEAFRLELPGASLRVTLGEDGGGEGFFAGPADTAYLASIARGENVNPAVADVLDALLSTHADLDADAAGVCHDISTTFDFEAVSAFWY